MSAVATQRLADQGFEALRRHQLQAARAFFQQAITAGLADADAQVGLALAEAKLGDAGAAHAALQAALLLQPRHLRALVLRADLLAQAGDAREAAAAYQLVLRAVPDPAPLPPPLKREWERARDGAARFAGQLQQALDERLQLVLREARAAHGEAATVRFAQAVEQLMGRQPVYRSAPSLFRFPGLADIAFFNPAHFDWIPALEAQTEVIREELRALLLQQDARFRPYVERVPGRPVLNPGGLLDKPDWSACYLWRDGEPVPAMQAACPRTVAALEALPLARVPCRTPNVLFSLLRPGAHIPPHHGLLNTRCIVHLPLIVPACEPPCRLRVGAELHAWREGRAVVFDDSIEHEAWNPSQQLRVVLLFEVWRPELTPPEREWVCRLFEALEAPALKE